MDKEHACPPGIWRGSGPGAAHHCRVFRLRSVSHRPQSPEHPPSGGDCRHPRRRSDFRHSDGRHRPFDRCHSRRVGGVLCIAPRNSEHGGRDSTGSSRCRGCGRHKWRWHCLCAHPRFHHDAGHAVIRPRYCFHSHGRNANPHHQRKLLRRRQRLYLRHAHSRPVFDRDIGRERRRVAAYALWPERLRDRFQ